MVRGFAKLLLKMGRDRASGSTDLVGELTNMVAGGAKARMSMHGLSLGLPTVVAGPAHQVPFSSGMNVSTPAFGSSQGLLAIDVELKA